jgi:hypothetical protein
MHHASGGPNTKVHFLAFRLPFRRLEIVGHQPVCGMGEVIGNIEVK